MANRRKRRLVAEKIAAQEAKLQQVLYVSKRKKRLKKKPLQTLKCLRNVNFQYKKLPKFEQTDLALLFARFAENEDRRKNCSFDKTYHFLKNIVRKNALCLFVKGNQEDLESLRIILEHHTKWVRDIEEWQAPKTRQNMRLYTHLLRHLFAKYPVPGFMDEAWWSNYSNQYSGYQTAKRRCKHYFIEWFLHIGSGKNIRKARHLPIIFTKKMAHYFLQVPDHLFIHQAIRWVQVLAMGGTKKQAKLIVRTRLKEGFENDDFWQQVIRFFLTYPELTLEQMHEIIAYIQSQKFDTNSVENIEGHTVILPAFNANWQVKGKTLTSLRREMYRWQQMPLNYPINVENHTWKPFPIDDFEVLIDGVNYCIQQITSLHLLYQEGLAMKHCVGTYASECFKGETSIWRLWKITPEGFPKRLVTIEVDDKLELIQMNRKNNETPTKLQKHIIQKWVKANGISK